MTNSFYVIFFDEDNNIKKANHSPTYPKVKDIVYLLKLLEKSELKEVENLKMDIITEEQFKEIE